MDSVVRSMEDYINFITPQFSRTHINFQRVPTVDTSNPFAAKAIPLAGRELCSDPFPQSAEYRFPPAVGDAAGLVYLAHEHPGGAGR